MISLNSTVIMNWGLCKLEVPVLSLYVWGIPVAVGMIGANLYGFFLINMEMPIAPAFTDNMFHVPGGMSKAMIEAMNLEQNL